MKRFKLFLVFTLMLCSFFEIKAQERTDSDGNTVYYPMFFSAQYQMGNFDYPKLTGVYGLGLDITSISHWGRFHVGANVNLSINAGIIDDWGVLIDFGPSARIDILNNLYINIPVNATCMVTFPEGTTDTKSNWGAKISPSLHYFFTKRVGVFVGPQVSFSDGTSVGFQVGLTYSM